MKKPKSTRKASKKEKPLSIKGTFEDVIRASVKPDKKKSNRPKK